MYERLKQICDKIGYEIKAGTIREIIFTQEFIDKLTLFIDKQEKDYIEQNWSLYLLDNLDNPVEYIYNLIFN